jgi:uncharacterized coiled-coil DUF342 family protein
MTDKELYQQKLQAQLDEWRSEIDKLKAKASGASADAKLEMNRQAEVLESKIEEGKKKLSELADASDDKWESMKDSMDSTWKSLKSAFNDAASKFKDK